MRTRILAGILLVALLTGAVATALLTASPGN